MKLRFRTWIVSLSLLGAISSGLSAQDTVNLASISGRVMDVTGGVLPGATIVARQMGTDVTTTTVTDPQGGYRFPNLRAGLYELTIALSGFKTKTQRVVVNAGSALDVRLTLEIGQKTIIDYVISPEPKLDPVRSQVAGTVTQPEV